MSTKLTDTSILAVIKDVPTCMQTLIVFGLPICPWAACKQLVWIHISYTACDVISFNGKDKFVHKFGHIKEIQNEHNSVKDTIEKGKKTSNINLTISMKLLLHYPPTCTCTCVLFFSSNPKILKASLTFPTKIKPTKLNALQEKKKWGMRSKKNNNKRREEKAKVKAKTAVSLLNPKTTSKLCFLRMPEVNFWSGHKLLVCENSCFFSLLSNLRTFCEKDCLWLSDRNFLLMT